MSQVPFDVQLTAVTPAAETATIAQLRTYPFFADVSDLILNKIRPYVLERSYSPGDRLLRLGAYNDAAYYVAEGVVEVLLPDDGRGPAAAPSGTPLSPRSLAEVPESQRSDGRILLGAGEMFGEMSALSRYPISADVVAVSAARCLVLRAPALRLMFKQPALRGFKESIDERYRERSLASQLRRVSVFADLDDETLEHLRARAELLSFEPAARIVEQGSPGEAFYLVRGGYVKVSAQLHDHPLAITYLGKGDYAGEGPLLTGKPWPFSLVAIDHVELVRIGRAELEEVLARYPSVRERLQETVETRQNEIELAAVDPLSSQHLQMAMDTGLINGQSVLLIDLTTCTDCDDCVRACADTHGGAPRLIRQGRRYQDWSIPIACHQCSDPVCMIGCPTGAISRPLGSLEVTINKDTCIGCGNCASRCPWGSIISLPVFSASLQRSISLPLKCDLCAGRSAGPACVQMCPHGSAVRISFRDLQTVSATLARVSDRT